jgi:hypothetical protein
VRAAVNDGNLQTFEQFADIVLHRKASVISGDGVTNG